MNTKILVFPICVEGARYFLSYNLHGKTFKLGMDFETFV